MLNRLRTKRRFALLLVSLLAIGATVWRACIVSKGADDDIEPDSRTAAIHEFDARDVLDPFAHVTAAMRPQFETANPVGDAGGRVAAAAKLRYAAPYAVLRNRRMLVLISECAGRNGCA